MNTMKLPDKIFLSIVFVLITGYLFLEGCAHRIDDRSLNGWVAPSSDRLWEPKQGDIPEPAPSAKPIDIPEELLKQGKKWRMADIIEVALRNNPETRQTWYAARAAAADWRSKQGSYYPEINASATAAHTERSVTQTQPDGSVNSFEPALELSWLLFDFGGREASVEEKRQALIAADFTHNASIQNTVFLVLQTYFTYADAKTLVNASKTTVDEASTNLEVAQERHQNGLSTIADVLQAKTALSQAQLNFDVVEGQVQIIRGALATAMGIPANTPYDIEDLAMDPPVASLTDAVETYIKQAEANRPDLAAQRARVEQSLARIRTTQSARYPKLVLSNSLSGNIDDSDSEWENRNTTALMLNIPVFKGYSLKYDALKARQDAEAERARLDSLQQTVILQVWSSYFNLKTSAQRVKSSDDLLKSAQRSYEVALGRYKEGVGGFLDLLSSQSALERARALRVESLAGWYISFGQLARDTGMLWSKTPGQKKSILDSFPDPTVKEYQK